MLGRGGSAAAAVVPRPAGEDADHAAAALAPALSPVPAPVLATEAMQVPAAASPKALPRGAFVLVVLVMLATGLGPVPVPLAFEQQDKLHHLLGFMVLVLSARLAFPRIRPSRLALGCLALALAIEAGQGLLSMRSASLIDMAANLLGVGAGLAVAALLGRRRLSRGEDAG